MQSLKTAQPSLFTQGFKKEFIIFIDLFIYSVRFSFGWVCFDNVHKVETNFYGNECHKVCSV